SKIETDRFRLWAGLALLIVAIAGCEGGGDGIAQQPEPRDVSCDSTSVLENGACRTFAERIDARASTPFTEDGEPVELEVVIFKPLEGERFPLLVVNHGSTGSGSDPSLFDDTFTHKPTALHFVERGWMVAFPQRRGRGQSDGLYDEGFTSNRSGYSCDATIALAGADRALDDLDAVTDWLRMRSDVDTTRTLVSGSSRGGILSIAYLARRPDVYLGAINFVGGWLGEGCGDFAAVNRTLFVDGAAFPGRSLWIYGENDSFYSLGHSQANFDAFTQAGGVGDFEVLQRDPGLNGHFIINDADRWANIVDGYIDEL
ncbi:MAG: prolyl oligopeptidase family serine peptidase, partial [Gammaproteobacteria bacterium]|nr:prolyl oligopeptidase family serine peptidase [Gammaproteobacteria bacterium]